MSLDARFAEAMGQVLGPDFPSDIGLAVSGGGDSMAMLTLAHNWSRHWGVRLWVVTVDHGLRDGSAAEAAMVAEECAALGWPHATLRWRWDGRGNLQDAARRARLALIGHWRGGLAHVLMGHTRDDLAETFLMRLARGSGVEGLSAMQASRRVTPDVGPDLPGLDHDGVLPPQAASGAGPLPHPASFRIVRPCLDMTRAELRHYLRTLQGRWVEDPSNEDVRFDRVKIRQAAEILEGLGLDVARLSGTARRMARAGEALRARAAEVWDEIGEEPRAGGVPTGELLFTRAGFERTERDTQLRLLAAALQYIATADYRPRAAALEALLDRVLGGGGGTLLGCEARMERDRVRVFREYAAVADLRQRVAAGSGVDRLWDGRWAVFHADLRGCEIGALGQDGWQQLVAPDGAPRETAPDGAPRETAPDGAPRNGVPDGAPPHASARSLPAIWQGNRLLACDALGVGPGGTTRLWPMGRDAGLFKGFLLSH